MLYGSETGSYLRLIDCVYHSTLGLRVMKKKKKYHATLQPVVQICKDFEGVRVCIHGRIKLGAKCPERAMSDSKWYQSSASSGARAGHISKSKSLARGTGAPVLRGVATSVETAAVSDHVSCQSNFENVPKVVMPEPLQDSLQARPSCWDLLLLALLRSSLELSDTKVYEP